MLVHALKSAKDRAKLVHCMHILNQIGVAVHAYGADRGTYVPVSGSNEPPWFAALSPYLGRSGLGDYTNGVWINVSPIVRCPATPTPGC